MIDVAYIIDGTRYMHTYYDNPYTCRAILADVSIDTSLPLDWLRRNFLTDRWLDELNKLDKMNILTVESIEVY